MDNNPIENLLKSTMENLKRMVDVDTIVGNPIRTDDGTTIIPVSRVSLGFVSGGSEFSCTDQNNEDSKYPFGGGSGAGVTVKPVAFLVVKDDYCRVVSLNSQNSYDKLIDSVPQILEIFKSMCKDKNNNEDTNTECKGKEHKKHKEDEDCCCQ